MIELYARKSNDTFFKKVNYLNMTFIRGSAQNTTFNAVSYMIHNPDKARMW